jgi:hypothetical protein
MNSLPSAGEIEDLEIYKQRICAVYRADDLSEKRPGTQEEVVCGKTHCGVIARICIDGVLDVGNDACSEFSQSSNMNFRRASLEDAL